MAQWNLSVELSARGSSLASELRRSAGEARTLSREVRRARQDIERLRTTAARDIRIGVSLDAGRLRSDLRAALAGAGGQSLTVTADVDAARAALGLDRLREAAQDTSHHLNRLQRYARETGQELDGLRASAATAATAIRSLGREAERSGERLGTLSDRSRTLRSDLDDLNTSAATLGGGLGSLRGSLGSVGQSASNSSGGLRRFLVLLGAISTAAVPLSAGLVASITPLVQQLGAAGVAAGAFGAAIAGQAAGITAAADAETKYREQVTLHGQASEEAIKAQQEWQAQLAALTPDAQRAAVAVSQLKSAYQDWSDSLSGTTLEPAIHGMAVMEELLPRLTPLAESAAGGLDRLVDVAGGAVQTPGFDRMMGRFEDYSDGVVDDLTDQVIHLMRALSEGDPGDGALGAFLGYMEEHGAQAREALASIGDAVGTLLEGAAEAGPVMLTLVSAVADLVAALPPELVGTIIQVYAAFKLVTMIGGGLAAVAAGVQLIGRRLLEMHVAAGIAGGGLAGLRAALLALSTTAKASIIVAGIGLLAVAISELSDIGKEAPPEVDKLTTALGELGRTGKLSGEAARVLGEDFSKLHDVVGKVADPSVAESINNWGADITGGFLDGGEATEEFTEKMEGVDDALASLVSSGKADLAAAAIARMTEGMNSEELAEFNGRLDDYKAAVADAAFESELAAEAQGLFGRQALEVSRALQEQKNQADGLRGAIVALNEVNRAAASEMSAFEQAIDDATKAADKYGDVLDMDASGHLDLDSEKAREAEKTLSDLAASADAAATAAIENGESWEYVSGIYGRGREEFVAAAEGMGLTAKEAERLADTYLKIPDEKMMVLSMRTEDAMEGLDAVIAAMDAAPNSKSVRVDALTDEAITLLEDVGMTVTRLSDGSFEVRANTGTAEDAIAAVKDARDGLTGKTIDINARTSETINSLRDVQEKVANTKGKTITMKAPTAEARRELEALGFKIKNTKGKNVVITVPTGGQRANVDALARSINGLRNRTVTITTHYRITGNTARREGVHGSQLANARGGVWDYYADGGIRGGRQRGGVRRFAAGAENHVAQIAPAGSWRVWAEPETGGEAYIPLSQSKRPRSRAIAEETIRRLGGDPQSVQWYADGGLDFAYSGTGQSLNRYTLSGLISASNDKKGNFSLSIFTSKLKASNNALAAWREDLATVARRAGQDVADALEAMGDDGISLTKKMAEGSNKYITSMASELTKLANAAKASLGEYTSQLNDAVKDQQAFQKNLATLAGQGYGSLATRLAGQGDADAEALAAAAVKSKSKAAAADKASKAADKALSDDQLQTLVQIIAAITSSKTGIHDIAAKTGLGEDEIITVANRAKSQISSSLGSRATKFLEDLGRANKHLSYADGGIRAGMYATSGGIVRFAEPSTGGEAYLPLGASKRSSAMPVLRDVAARFGVGLTDAHGGRQVVIVRSGDTNNINIPVTRPGASAADIAAKVGREMRRARRGGVAARAA